MRSEGYRPRTTTKTSLSQSITRTVTAILVVFSIASCDSDSNEITSPLGGGPAIVMRDGSAPDGGNHGGNVGKAGGGGRGGVGGAGGRGSAGSTVVATGGAGGVVGTGGVGGGANGGAAQVDACRACELRRCTKPQNDDGSLTIAYDLCFLDQAVPVTPPELRVLCGSDDLADRLTSGGDQPGTPKAALCHAVLACMAKTKCAGSFGTDHFEDCYCGAGVTPQQCSAVTFVPQGKCAAEMAAGYESTSNTDISKNFYAACLASGAATNAYFGCYENCCSKECLGVDPPPGVDDSTCNAPAASTGGTTGTGTGGTAATGGTIGTGGTTATGGTIGTGGAAGNLAAGGHGGSAGAAGSGGTGTGGGAPAPMVSHFNGTTAPWIASYGALVNYSSTDASGASTSGALDLLLTNGSASITSVVAATECVSAVAGATYDLSAQIFLPPQMTGSLAGLGLWFYSSNDCSSGLSSTFASPQIATVSSWQPLSASATVPTGTQSMSVRLTVTKPAGKTTVEALFDDVSVMKR